MNSGFVGPLSQGHGLTECSDLVISARVIRLLLWRGPATVARFVVAVAVDSFYRLTGRWLTHVCEKVLERLPSLAHADASATINTESSARGVGAARLHPLPSCVCFRYAAAHAMRSAALDRPKYPVATTGSGFSTNEACCENISLRATGALALPIRLVVTRVSETQHSPTPKLLAGKAGSRLIHNRQLCRTSMTLRASYAEKTAK